MASTVETTYTTSRTLADLLHDLGDVPLERVLAHPPPGTATEQDVIRHNDAVDSRTCELIDGVLVRKTMGAFESAFMMVLGALLHQYVRQHKLGYLLGEQGMIRLQPNLVRIPDISFFASDRLPGGKIPRQAMMDMAPDLAIEILSPSNTAREMVRKRRDYFAAGARRVWEIDPLAGVATVCTDTEHSTPLSENDSLDGGDVLPGFSLRLSDILAELAP